MKHFILLTYLLCFTVFLQGQNNLYINEHLEWTTEYCFDSDSVPNQCLNCDKCNVSLEKNLLPVYAKKIPLPSHLSEKGKISAKIHNASFVEAIGKYFSRLKNEIQQEIRINVAKGWSKKKPFVMISFVPLVQNSSGTIQQLVDFELEIFIESDEKPTNTTHLKQSETITNSILNQGTFYKMRVTEEGIHKIDYALLESLNVPIAEIEMNRLRVYGNGGGMLPEKAGEDRQDDLLENPIQVIDQNGNNKFDQGDYALFFGESPNQWYWEDGLDRYKYITHLYSQHNHYFLNFDIGAGKRITEANNDATPNNTTTSFDALAAHESEQYNIMGSGRVWFGDQMFSGGEKSFTFSFPNLIKDEGVWFMSRFAAKSHEANSRMDVTVNGTSIGNVSLSKVGQRLESPGGSMGSIEKILTIPVDNVALKVNYTNLGGSDGKGWIDYLQLNARRKLNLSATALGNGQQLIRDHKSVGEGNITRFELESPAANLRVWDVSDVGNAQSLSIVNNAFVVATDTHKKFIAFDNSNHFVPEVVGQISRQNLHEEVYPDMLIIVPERLKTYADELADFHRTEDGLEVKVVDVKTVYNEFSSGNQDITAIRDYVKMYYDRASTAEDLPEYLLLFGDASYDYKNISLNEEENTNLIPIYESNQAVNRLSSYCSDDYFAMLDDGEGFMQGSGIDIGTFNLDIAVGRIPAHNEVQAAAVINKIKHYKSSASLGEWWNNITFVSDDGNNNLHLNHAESHSKILDEIAPIFNIDKYYIDAFPQLAGPSGDTYPDANKAILNRIFSGSLVMNYIGHGSEKSWAKEGILTKEIIKTLENIDKLPLFITATCTFSRIDDPFNTSAGEWLLINPNGGGVAIVSTVRVVGANGNKEINKKFLEAAFQKQNGEYPTLGEAVMMAKNNMTGSATNYRKFTLLGDPALRLNYPNLNVRTTNIKNETLEIDTDTVQALSRVRISGEIVDAQGNLIPNFNGILTPVVFDKSITLTTIGNDTPTAYDPEVGGCPPETNSSRVDEVSCPTEFDLQQNIIFRGNVSVENGKFDFSFIVPKDISFNYGNGKISYFAQNELNTASGLDTNLVIGGVSELVEEDTQGPEVNIFLNDENFVFGGLTAEEALLLVKLEDVSGINTVGTGIGHDVTGKLDEEGESKVFVLNNYYKTELDDFQKGRVEFPLTDLIPGRHTLRVKAWDVFNNSGEGYTEFLVAESAEMALQNVLNYPNPFTDKTNFWFEHNRAGDNLKVHIRVYTLSGRVIKSIHKEFVATGNRVTDIEWDGLDEFGNKIGRGVYVYQLSVTASDNTTVSEVERLVILK